LEADSPGRQEEEQMFRNTLRYPSRLIAFLWISSLVSAQQVTLPSTGHPGLDRFRAAQIAVYATDFGQLERYRDVNSSLRVSAVGENRVVFFGDSITDLWKLEDYFPGKPYLNRGIGGQTTSQMLVRFRQDVIDLHPKVVVILAGTNDIAGNSGPMSLEAIEENYASFAELARAHNIRVIFSSILPVHNYSQKWLEFFTTRPPETILALNRWLKEYCQANATIYLDYFSAMVDEKGLLKRDLAEDGLHPNQAGYRIMAPLAERAIAKALSTNLGLAAK
jgi:lysophospholipase L1-like esterase